VNIIYFATIDVGGVSMECVNNVKVAVFTQFSNHYKAPVVARPDGVNFGFIKDFWLDMKEDLMHFVSDFHQNGNLLKGINNTFIYLIPKKDSP